MQVDLSLADRWHADGGRLPAWCAGVVVLQGLAVAAYFLLFPSVQAHDFQVFYHAGQQALRGEVFVGGFAPNVDNSMWAYPPVVVVYFIPFALLPTWQSAFLLHGVVTLGVLVWFANYVATELVDASGVERLALSSAIVVNPYTVQNFAQGQINVLATVLLVLGVVWTLRAKPVWGGVALALAATMKLWPIFLGLWLLRLREWRAVVAAIATGLGGLVLGSLLFGVSQIRLLFDVYFSDQSALPETVTPNIEMIGLERTVAALIPGLNPTVAFGIVIVVCGAALAWVYARPLKGSEFALAGFTACVGILALPSSIMWYVIAPLTMGLVVLHRTGREEVAGITAAGILISGVPVGLHEIQAIASVVGVPAGGEPLYSILAAAPPAIVGSVLLAVGMAMAARTPTPHR